MTTKDNALPSNTAVDKVLVVDIGKRQSKKRIKNLREGRGALFDKVLETLNELRADGTIEENVRPVVVVVRERKETTGGFLKF